MTLPELLALPIQGKNVILIGEPAAGKTFISNLLGNPFHELIHTDDLVTAGYTLSQAVQSVFEDIADCNRRNRPTITEGVLGYSLLLVGVKQQAYFPQIVIDVKISRAKQREIYLNDPKREPGKIKYLKKFAEGHLMAMNEYHRIVPAENKPTWITFLNEWNYATEVKD